MRHLVFLIVTAFSVCGCAANPYTSFYQDELGGAQPDQVFEVEGGEQQPEIYVHQDIVPDYISMLENGYALIGQSSFNASSVNQNEALKHAEDVGAHVVLVASEYTDTQTVTSPDVAELRC